MKLVKTFYSASGEPHKKPAHAETRLRLAAYVLVLNADDELLVTIPKISDKYDLPGGGLDSSDEHSRDAAVRECYEEAGYKISIQGDQPFWVSEYFFVSQYDGEYIHNIALTYRAKLRDETFYREAVNSNGKEETASVHWIPIGDLHEGNMIPIHYAAVNALQRELIRTPPLTPSFDKLRAGSS